MPANAPLRCLIVDDERLARLELAALLEEAGGCHLLGGAANVEDGLRLLEKTNPQVLFLDVEMPGANGFELLTRVKDPPLIVFVTAYANFAVRAFSVQATDYLLKPVRPGRMQQCLTLIRQRLASPLPDGDRLFLPNRDGGRFISIGDIHLVRAYDHYLRIYHPAGNEMLRETLSVFEDRLPNDRFFRANRSEIIRLAAVTTVKRLSRGRYSLLLPGDERVVVSEGRSRVLRGLGVFGG